MSLRCADLLAVLVRLLWPKMRKRSGRLGGKGAPGSARAAILNFLAALPPGELRPLLVLFLAPLGSVLRPPRASSLAAVPKPASSSLHLERGAVEQAAPAHAGSASGAAAAADGGSGGVGGTQYPDIHPHRVPPTTGLFEEPWWAPELGSGSAAWWLAASDARAIAALPARTRLGFLNAAADLLRHLGHRLAPYLPALAALVVVALEAATAPLSRAPGGTLDPGTLPVLLAAPARGAGAGPAGDQGLAMQGLSKVGEAGLPNERDAEGAGECLARQATPQVAQAGSVERMTGEGVGNEGSAKPSEPPQEGLASQGLADGAREVRGAAQQLLAELWGRFPDAADWAPLWPRFFAAAAPLAQRLPAEVGRTSLSAAKKLGYKTQALWILLACG